MLRARICVWMTLAMLASAVLVLSACKSAPKGENQPKENAQQACDCPKESTKEQSEAKIFLRDALFPREWREAEKQEAGKSVRNYRQGFFAGPGGSWGSCQFEISDELLAKILADKEARAKKKEFIYRTDTPPESFRNWFDTAAMGLFQNKKGILQPCQVPWWSAGKHKGEYFRSWERTVQPNRWSVVVKVCPLEKGMRWVFFRVTAE